MPMSLLDRTVDDDAVARTLPALRAIGYRVQEVFWVDRSPCCPPNPCIADSRTNAQPLTSPAQQAPVTSVRADPFAADSGHFGLSTYGRLRRRSAYAPAAP